MDIKLAHVGVAQQEDAKAGMLWTLMSIWNICQNLLKTWKMSQSMKLLWNFRIKRLRKSPSESKITQLQSACWRN